MTKDKTDAKQAGAGADQGPAAPAPATTAPAAATAPPTTPLQATLELARRGNPVVLPKLREVLDAQPELWQHYGDLAGAVERSWVSLLAGKDLLITESIARQLEALRQELGGTNRLEKLIVERIVSAWLQVQHAEQLLALADGESVKVRQFMLKSGESAERRFQAACRNLAIVRRLLGGVELRVQHTHNMVAPGTPPPAEPATTPTMGVDDMRRAQLFGRGGEPLPVGMEGAHV